MIENQQGLTLLVKKAHDKGVGVITMKTLMGARLNDLSRYQKDGAPFHRAAFGWVLSNPDVDALIVSMKNPRTANRDIACSGDPAFRKADAEVLKHYIAANTADYCRNACNACESSCPYDVPIADVLRQRMYAEKYGDLELAQRGYDALGAGASPCLSCVQPACANACDYGLDIPDLTRATARSLG